MNWITIEQANEKFSIPKPSLYYHIKNGKFKIKKIGRKIYIDESSIFDKNNDDDNEKLLNEIITMMIRCNFDPSKIDKIKEIFLNGK